MNVSVFGLGYVGCVTAACLARAGHRVVGVDVNADKVDMIRSMRSPIVEPGLNELLGEVVSDGRLTATSIAAEAVASSDVALVCVGTPSLPNGRPDTAGIERVGEEIGAALKGRPTMFTVVLRSTCLPGTAECVLLPAVWRGAGPDSREIGLAVNPEFMREGSSIADFEHPPIIVVGCRNPAVADVVRELYRSVPGPFIATTIKTAELVKYVSNAYHALKVRFANEIGDLCGALDVDAQEVMQIFALDRKLNISAAYLRPGFAFGGSCLPKDLRALAWAARSHDLSVPVLSAVLPSNAAHIRDAADSILAHGNRRIGVVGLAFKPGTDDLRESPMVTLIELLIGKGCDVRIYDRNVAIARLVGANRRYIETEIPHIASLLCDSIDALVQHAAVLVVGNADEDSAQAVMCKRSDCHLVDLTRGAVRAVSVRTPIPSTN